MKQWCPLYVFLYSYGKNYMDQYIVDNTQVFKSGPVTHFTKDFLS